MPRYSYICTGCDFSGDLVHSYKEGPGNCPSCDKDSLQKNFSKKVVFYNPKHGGQKYKNKIGKVVESEIKNSSNDLKKQKQNLRGRKKK